MINSMGSKRTGIIAKIGKLIVPFFVMFLIIYEARSILRDIDLNEVWNLVTTINPSYLVIFLLISIISILCLCGYDVLLINHYKYGIGMPTIYKVAWISATFNNMIGLGGLIGAGIRTYLFKKEGIDTKDLINYNIILVPSTILGLGIFSILSVLGVLNTYALLNVYKWLVLPLAVFCIFVPLYFMLGKIQWINKLLKRFNLFFEGSFSIKMKFVLCSTIDWLSRGILLYAIARSFNPGIPVLSVVGIDTMSSVAGLISFIPNGIGSYDIVALMGFELLGYSGNTALSIILLFRIFYFIIPWIIGGIMWILTMIFQCITKK